MDIKIRGKNVELTPALKGYIEEKIGGLGKYFEHVKGVDVALTVERNRSIENTQRAEVTMRVDGTVIRGEEASVSMYSSIDIVIEKLERQLKKYKSRIYASMRDRRPGKKTKRVQEEVVPVEEEEAIISRNAEPMIARTKVVSLRPMTASEATLQMELLGHDFHLFLNPETGGVNLVYRRRDGNYGLLVPETIE
jgi:putative sigma-54 modulation protein